MADIVDLFARSAGVSSGGSSVESTSFADVLRDSADKIVDDDEYGDRAVRAGAETGRPWTETADILRQRNIDPAQYRQAYQLREEQRRLATTGEMEAINVRNFGRFVARNAIPLASQGVRHGEHESASEAMKRFREGRATKEDAATIARYERQQENDARQGQTLGGSINKALAQAPAFVGEFAGAGKVLQGAAWLARGGRAAQAASLIPAPMLNAYTAQLARVPLAAAKNPGLLARAGGLASHAGRMAVLTPMVPSMYLEHAAQNNMAAGRDPSDPRGFPTALGYAYANMAILGHMQAVGNNVRTLAGRVGAKGAIGVGEQATLDVWAGLADQVLAEGYKTNTRYGVLGQLIGIDQERDVPAALRNAASQAVTFSLFAGLHDGVAGAKRVQKEYSDYVNTFLEARGERQATLERVAGKYGEQILGRLQKAMAEKPDLTRGEARAMFSHVKDPAVRKFVDALTESIPDPGDGRGKSRPSAEKPAEPAKPAEVVEGGEGFTTERGSTYTMDGGRTQRTKAARGGDPDSGLKEKSDRTLFLSPEHAQAVGMWQGLSAQGKRVVVANGEVLLTSINPKSGERGIDGRFPFTTTPEVGRNPLELWGKSESLAKDGLEGYRGNHPGSRITEVRGRKAQPGDASDIPREAWSPIVTAMNDAYQRAYTKARFQDGKSEADAIGVARAEYSRVREEGIAKYRAGEKPAGAAGDTVTPAPVDPVAPPDPVQVLGEAEIKRIAKSFGINTRAKIGTILNNIGKSPTVVARLQAAVREKLAAKPAEAPGEAIPPADAVPAADAVAPPVDAPVAPGGPADAPAQPADFTQGENNLYRVPDSKDANAAGNNLEATKRELFKDKQYANLWFSNSKAQNDGYLKEGQFQIEFDAAKIGEGDFPEARLKETGLGSQQPMYMNPALRSVRYKGSSESPEFREMAEWIEYHNQIRAEAGLEPVRLLSDDAPAAKPAESIPAAQSEAPRPVGGTDQGTQSARYGDAPVAENRPIPRETREALRRPGSREQMKAEQVTGPERELNALFERTTYARLPSGVRERFTPLIDELARITGRDRSVFEDTVRHAWLSQDGRNRGTAELEKLWRARLEEYRPTPEELAEAERSLAKAQKEYDDAEAEAQRIVAEADQLGRESLARSAAKAAAREAAIADAADVGREGAEAPRGQDPDSRQLPPGVAARGEGEPAPGRGERSQRPPSRLPGVTVPPGVKAREAAERDLAEQAERASKQAEKDRAAAERAAAKAEKEKVKAEIAAAKKKPGAKKPVPGPDSPEAQALLKALEDLVPGQDPAMTLKALEGLAKGEGKLEKPKEPAAPKKKPGARKKPAAKPAAEATLPVDVEPGSESSADGSLLGADPEKLRQEYEARAERTKKNRQAAAANARASKVDDPLQKKQGESDFAFEERIRREAGAVTIGEDIKVQWDGLDPDYFKRNLGKAEYGDLIENGMGWLFRAKDGTKGKAAYDEVAQAYADRGLIEEPYWNTLLDAMQEHKLVEEGRWMDVVYEREMRERFLGELVEKYQKQNPDWGWERAEREARKNFGQELANQKARRQLEEDERLLNKEGEEEIPWGPSADRAEGGERRVKVRDDEPIDAGLWVDVYGDGRWQYVADAPTVAAAKEEIAVSAGNYNAGSKWRVRKPQPVSDADGYFVRDDWTFFYEESNADAFRRAERAKGRSEKDIAKDLGEDDDPGQSMFGMTVYGPSADQAEGGGGGKAGPSPFSITETARRLFGVPEYVTRSVGDRARYRAREQGIETGTMGVGSVGLAAHEVAEHILRQGSFETNPARLPKEVARGLAAFDYEPGRRMSRLKMSEGFAEWFRLRTTDQLTNLTPDKQAASDYAEKWLGDQALTARADRLRDMWRRYNEQSPERKAAGLVSETGRAAGPELTRGEALAEFRESVASRVADDVVDDLAVIRRAEAHYEAKNGKKLPPGRRPSVILEHLMGSEPSIAGEFLRDGAWTIQSGRKVRIGQSEAQILDGLLPADLASRDGAASEFDTYAVARSVLADFEMGQTPVPEWQRSQYQAVVDSVNADPAKRDRYEAAAKRLTKAFNDTLRVLESAEVHYLKPGTVDALEQRRPMYVPHTRVAEKDSPKLLQAREGHSAEQIVSPMVSYHKRVKLVAGMLAKQIRMNAVMKLLKEPGMADFALFGETVPTKEAQDIAKRALDVFNLSGAQLDQALADVEAGRGVPLATTVPWQDGKANTVWWAGPGGELTNVRVRNRALFDLLTDQTVDAHQMARLVRGVAEMKVMGVQPLKLMSTGARKAFSTLSLGFQVRNIPRDVYQFWANTIDRTSANPSTIWGAYRDLYSYYYNRLRGRESGDPLLEAFVRDRGEDLRQFNEFRPDRPDTAYTRQRKAERSRLARTVHSVWGLAGDVLNLAGAGELAPRYVEWVTRLKQVTGKSEAELRESFAAAEAKARAGEQYVDPVPLDLLAEAKHAAHEVTTPFGRQGSVTRQLNKIQPFFGPAVAGFAKAIRNWRDNPKGASYALAALIVARTIHWLAVSEEDWYQELKANDRYENFVVNTPAGLRRFPAPRGLDVAGGGLVPLLLDSVAAKNPDVRGYLARSLESNTPPVPITPFGQILWDLQGNENWQGSPIVPKSEADASRSRKLTEYQLPYAAKQLGAGGFGVTPFTEVRNARRSVDEFYARLEELRAEAEDAKRRGGRQPAELTKFENASRQMAELSRQARGEALRNGRKVKVAEPTADQVAAVRRRQIELARKLLGK